MTVAILALAVALSWLALYCLHLRLRQRSHERRYRAGLAARQRRGTEDIHWRGRHTERLEAYYLAARRRPPRWSK